jgi:hypothetical protein
VKVITFARVQRDTDEALTLEAPASLEDLQQAVADAPKLVRLDNHTNDKTGLPFTGWLVDAPVGLYTTTCLNGDLATITNLDHLFSVR